MNGNPIERVDKFYFLGLLITDTLNWDAHISKISSKILKVTGIMNRLKHILLDYNLKLLYDALILPHLNYCIIIWGKNCSKLFKIQKKAIRIICKSKYNAHTEPLFKICKTLKVQDIYNMFCLKFYYKFKNGMLPQTFDNFLSCNVNIHDHLTRQSNQPHFSKCNTSMALGFLRHYIPTLINESTPLITHKVETHSYEGFSNYVKNFYITNYKTECCIKNCYICNT